MSSDTSGAAGAVGGPGGAGDRSGSSGVGGGSRRPNRLAGSSSPYLLQHAGNPVDWWEWGPEALAEAARRDVPILLSVGYAACHWCHVMAHESFEDPDVAAVLNDSFVPIKVDREERPDVDALYMEAVQALTGQGGWPMTVFLTPDGRPFFGGTYFPPEARHGLPGFPGLLAAVSAAWRERRAAVLADADSLLAAVRQRTRLPARGGAVGTVAPRAPREGADAGGSAASDARLGPTASSGVAPLEGVDGPAVLAQAFAALVREWDRARGGFGRAPKFPQPAVLDLLARLGVAPVGGVDPGLAVEILESALGAMAAGGIRDHLGGGFARYATDAAWLVPHFEKMAYDQAGLARAYLHAWQATGRATWLGLAEETLEYLCDELGDPAGGLHSSEDADSPEGEGRYYVWTPAEVEGVLGPELAGLACEWWGVTDRGNFAGRSILHRPWPPPGGTAAADTLRLSRGELPADIEAARARLAAARLRRARPGRDDKVLTEWNAMAAGVLAEAALATGSSRWLAAAERIGTFLLGALRRADGRWLRSYRQGRAGQLAVAADYAWLVDAFTRLGEASGRAIWTDEAHTAAAELVRLFWDAEDGGFDTVGRDAPPLAVRMKDVFDGAIPSANATAAFALWRLGRLLGNEELVAKGERILAMLADWMRAAPLGAGWALVALHATCATPSEVVVPGVAPDLVAEVGRRFLPGAVLAWGDPYDSPLWAGRQTGRAYVCRGYACGLPAERADELGTQLDAIGGVRR